MAVLSGIGGAVDSINTVRQWSVNQTGDLQAYTASNTKQAVSRESGNSDWTGQYQAYGGVPVKMPTETFTFTGSIDGTNGVVGPAIVESVTIEWDMEASSVLSHTVNFASNGTLVRGAAVGVDATIPDPQVSLGTKIESSLAIAVPSYTEILDIRTVSLSFSANNPSYASSSTSGFIKRQAGNLDMSCSYSRYLDDFSDLPAENEVHMYKVFVDSTLFWDLQYMVVQDLSDMEVDIEGAGMVGATVNAFFTGFADIAGTETEGKIDKPGAVSYWPFS